MPEDELNDTYDLDLDADSDDGDRERAIREAMRAAEEAVAVSGRHRRHGHEQAAEPATGEAEGTDAHSGEDEEVVRLRQELAETKERALRTLADFENYRKRTEREREEVRIQAIAELLRSFLEVRDNLERALGSRGSNDDLKVGVEMILKQVKELNRNFGVEEIEAMSCPFDPAVHDAVGRREDPSVEVPTVVDELQRGYLYRGRLLRPARVMVAVPPERTAPGQGGATAGNGNPHDSGKSSDA